MRETVIFMIFQYWFDAVGAVSSPPAAESPRHHICRNWPRLHCHRQKNWHAFDHLVINTLSSNMSQKVSLKIPCKINIILTRVNTYFPRCVSASSGWRRNLHQNHLYLLQQKHHPSSHQGAETKSESLSGETRYIQCRKGLNSYNMTYYPTRVYSWFFSFSPIVVFNGFSLKIVTCSLAGLPLVHRLSRLPSSPAATAAAAQSVTGLHWASSWKGI